MALVLPDGFGLATVHIRGASSGRDCINVWGLDNNTSTAQENAEALRDAYENTIMDAITAGYVLSRVKVVQNDGGTYTAGEASSTQPGGLAVASDPPQVSWLVKKITTAPGRAGRGRVYIPGVPELQTDGSGFITPSAVADMQTALDAMMVGYAGGLLVLLHRDPLNPSDYTFAAPTPILTLQAESQVATQRRRLR